MYKITISDTKTGDVLLDTETKCVIGGFEQSGQDFHFGMANCSPSTLASVIIATETTISEILQDHDVKEVYDALQEMEKILWKL